ncbi:hypothetical protein [Clostridium beijerinckii]|uniref:hypothetical protein n=1 Tax=Clostridium beijerinckii TaxID=1520 RepID=UPI00098C45C0|nr:hypothetical protein [Clostridium beijerinckii]NRT76339.1 DNA polymerase III sliding clamp (beta) subunit (PCNA family) [Clostridium beijerinckii]OOM48624.1 DNA polymerase III subunit beta [Clostridium beijerinckii]
MKAIVNSESLLLLSKLVKDGKYQVIVKGGSIKLLAESELNEYQVEIIEPYNSEKEDGELAIPQEVFALLPKKTSLVIENNVIKTEDQEIKLDPGTMSIIPIDIHNEECINIPNFNKLVECKYAIAKDEARPALQCLYIDKNNIVALDGYRMSVRSNKENITCEPILIPYQIVKLLRNFSKNDIATIYHDDNYIKICFSWVSIMCKRPRDKKGDKLKFINYESLFPNQDTTRVTLNALELADICKQITKLNSYSQIVNFNFNSNGSYLVTRVQGIRYKKYFKCRIDGSDLDIAVNAKYMLETLRNYKGDATLCMSNVASPITITDYENKKDLVLPIIRK